MLIHLRHRTLIEYRWLQEEFMASHTVTIIDNAIVFPWMNAINLYPRHPDAAA